MVFNNIKFNIKKTLNILNKKSNLKPFFVNI